jgi:hypothetical protein
MFFQNQMEDQMVWETVVDHQDYEICRSFPYQIRKIETEKIIKECENPQHYVLCHLNQETHRKHRIIAAQFIENPNNYTEVDHKNKIRNDNRIENLRWVSHKENMENVKSMRGFEFEYFDNLPCACQSFDFYNGHDFEGYSIDEEKNMYYHNGLMFRKLQRLLKENKYPFYRMKNIEGKQINVFLSKIDL